MKIKQITKKCKDGVIFIDKKLFKRNKARDRRAKRKHRTTDKQKEINSRIANRKILEMIHNNFEGGIFLTLTFAQLPDNLRKEIDNFLRRLKYRYNKCSCKLKYIAAVEFQECRPHLHIIINKNAIMDTMNKSELEDHIKKVWKNGDIVNIRPLERRGYYKNLAEYLVKETAAAFNDCNSPFNCRCIHSQGLELPEAETEIIEGDYNTLLDVPDTEIIDGEEYELIWDSQYTGRNEFTGSYYVTYALKPIAKNRQRRRKKAIKKRTFNRIRA